MDVKLLIIFKFIFWKLWYKHTFLNYLTTKVEKNQKWLNMKLSREKTESVEERLLCFIT